MSRVWPNPYIFIYQIDMFPELQPTCLIKIIDSKKGLVFFEII